MSATRLNPAPPVTGVKGSSESSYRTGNVNLTAANVGAAASGHTHSASALSGSASTRSGYQVTAQAYRQLNAARYFTLTVKAINAIAANTEYEVCGLPWSDNNVVVATGAKYFVGVTYAGAVRVISPFAMGAGSNLYIRGMSIP